MIPTGPSSELVAEIDALFSWNPPPLHLLKDSSTSTRSPAFYDQHFSPDLFLKKVEHLPTLVSSLAENVDKSLGLALKTLPPLTDESTFFTSRDRAKDATIDVCVLNNSGLCAFYDKTTAKYCSPVASMLALHPKAPIFTSLLTWTLSDPSPGYAMIDGLLRFTSTISEPTTEDRMRLRAQRARILETMDSKKRHIVKKLRDSMSPLATWEMKNLGAGSAQVMTAIRNLGEFSWLTCATVDSKISQMLHATFKEEVKTVHVGPDAKASPWTLPIAPPDARPNKADHDTETDIQSALQDIEASSATLQPSITRRVTRSATKQQPSRLPPSIPSTSTSLVHEKTANDGSKKRKQGNDDEAYVINYPEEKEPVSDASKRRKLDDGDKTYRDCHEKTAQQFVQQAWVQAVRVDATIIVLRSGNHEVICVRHRKSQTLYVSDIIEPPTCANPEYGKLHVGIYLAAIQETLDRQMQASNLKSIGDDSDLIVGDMDQDHRDNNLGPGGNPKDNRGHRKGRRRSGSGAGRSSGFQGSAGRKDFTADELSVTETMEVASQRNVILLYLRYGVYNSVTPSTFFRSAASLASPNMCPTGAICAEECLTVVLTSEIGRGATGVAHRGTLEPETSPGTIPLDIVVKLAFSDDQREALWQEYGFYQRLRAKGVTRGIVTVLGFFNDIEGHTSALVMRYAGISLTKHPNLSTFDYESALSTLDSIHDADILHGDIRSQNILFNDGVTIIDFGNSTHCEDQRAKDEEYAYFRHLLKSANKKKHSTS